MPITYSLVGGLTNIIAVKMIFSPMEFIGIKPYLGWQGIVPKKSSLLALNIFNLVAKKYLQLDLLFKKIDPDILRKDIKEDLTYYSDEICNKFIAFVNKDKQSILLQSKQWIKFRKDVRTEASKSLDSIIHTMQTNLSSLFNFKIYFVNSFSKENKGLITNVFQDIGKQELYFIKKSGFYFGFLFGLIQMGIWIVYPMWWTLVLQGILVGYITNWLALFLIFRPINKKHFLIFELQGLFLKRQDDVSRQYASILNQHVFDSKKLLNSIFYQPFIYNILDTALQKFNKIDMPVTNQICSQSNKDKIVSDICLLIHKNSSSLQQYFTRFLNIESRIYNNLRKLAPIEFEGLLRSAFQQDEYILIIIGSIIGGLVGALQAIYIIFYHQLY